MATLEADSMPPQPLHPTMPLYASRENHLHSSELNFHIEQPSKPKIWDIMPLGTKLHAALTLCPITTMAIITTMAHYDTTLPTLFSLQTASVSTPW